MISTPPAGPMRRAADAGRQYSSDRARAICAADGPATGEVGLELAFGTRLAANAHVVRQAVDVGRVVLAGDQRLEVAPAGGRDAEAVRGDEIARHLLFDVGHLGPAAPARSSSDRASRTCAMMVGITAFMPFTRVFHRRLAHRVGLVDVDLRGDVARGALQVVGHRPVVLVAELLAHHVGDHRADAAELRVAEGIASCRLRPGTCRPGISCPRRPRSRSSRSCSRTASRARGTAAWSKAISGNRMMCGGSPGLSAGESAGRGDPAGVPAHHFQHEHLGGGARHRGDIERRLRASRPRRTWRPSRSPGSSRSCGRSLSTVLGTPTQVIG